MGKDYDYKEYILQVSDLENGSLLPEKAGTEVSHKQIDREMIVKDGYYFHLDYRSRVFTKYKQGNGMMNTVASVNLPGFSIENYNWIGKDSLLLTGLETAGYSSPRYVLIETRTMNILLKGDLDIPGPFGDYTSMSIGFVNLSKGSLFVGYTYHTQISTSDYTSSDTTYIAELKYPAMKRVKIMKDTRSTYPGGINTVQSYSFTDEHNNFYFMTCPGIALGNRPDRPTGIYRINNGSDTLDNDYFFDISHSAINNHSYGIWYAGNNKAIVRSERKDLYTGIGDHWLVPHFEFYVIDLLSGSAEKLPLPLDKGTRKECVIVEGEKAYIAVNSSTEGNYIWVYNIRSGKLTKGLQLKGDTDYILRIDRLNP